MAAQQRRSTKAGSSAQIPWASEATVFDTPFTTVEDFSRPGSSLHSSRNQHSHATCKHQQPIYARRTANLAFPQSRTGGFIGNWWLAGRQLMSRQKIKTNATNYTYDCPVNTTSVRRRRIFVGLSSRRRRVGGSHPHLHCREDVREVIVTNRPRGKSKWARRCGPSIGKTVCVRFLSAFSW